MCVTRTITEVTKIAQQLNDPGAPEEDARVIPSIHTDNSHHLLLQLQLPRQISLGHT